MKTASEFADREYNARASIAEHPQIFARWAVQAAQARRRQRALLDLSYGDSSAEKLDFFPARDDGASLFVFIHGGYWRSLDKADFSWMAPVLNAHGIAVALLNYGLAPRFGLVQIVRQVLAALAWLWRNGDRLRFNPNRIFVGGHSAGGHLTAMSMAAHFDMMAPDLPGDLIKGGVAISGLFDLVPLVDARFLNADLKLDVPLARALSPSLMTPATDAPLLTAVGALESTEFHRQSELIGRLWLHNVIGPTSVPGANHLTVCDAIVQTDSALFAELLALLRQ